MQQGKSYLVKIKLKPKFSYLFSDGTWGTLSANPGKFRHFRINGIYFSYTTKNDPILVRPFVYF